MSFILFFCIIWCTVHALLVCFFCFSLSSLLLWARACKYTSVCEWLCGCASVCTPPDWLKLPVTKALFNHSTYHWVTTWPIFTQLLLVEEQEARADAQTGHSPKPEGKMCGWGLTLTTHYQEFATHSHYTMDVLILRFYTQCLLDMFCICCDGKSYLSWKNYSI